MKLTSYSLAGMHITNHEFAVPLDYRNPERDSITVFAREVIARECLGNVASMPWLIFFQGGPGFQSPRPYARDGWLKRALQEYRVLLLDQRGTGLSSPITYQTVEHMSDPAEQAQYLKYFRADSIVQDAELIRRHLLEPTQKWTALGQSYGGFCLMHYLSKAPEGLSAAIITGGLPPLTAHVDDVYRATYARVIGKNEKFFERYPMDEARVKDIIEALNASPVELPGGGTLSAERFQQLGIVFGMSDGFELMHYLLEDAFVQAGGKRVLSHAFLKSIEHLEHFDTNPIYALLHEAIYCQNFASRWSAQRVRKEYGQFDASRGSHYFTGEMIYPAMFDSYKYLRPLKETAHILAECEDWDGLYDLEQLRRNQVPTIAAIYYDDMYVEAAFSQETANLVANTRVWITNEYEHNAIRADGERVLDRLLAMINQQI